MTYIRCQCYKLLYRKSNGLSPRKRSMMCVLNDCFWPPINFLKEEIDIVGNISNLINKIVFLLIYYVTNLLLHDTCLCDTIQKVSSKSITYN